MKRSTKETDRSREMERKINAYSEGRTRPSSSEYRSNWDKIFKKKAK